MAREEEFSVVVKRAAALHSHGVCQYRNCKEKVVRVDPVSGTVTELGRYAHILPAGDRGPRAEYRAQYPNIELKSFENIILLCSNHHDLVDKFEIAKHPPQLLFQMKHEKSNLLQDVISGELEYQASMEIALDDYAQQYELSAVINEFRKARDAGPRHGARTLKAAETVMRGVLKNPYFKKGEIGEVLVTTEHVFTRLFILYKHQTWLDAYKHVMRVLRIAIPDILLFHVFVCSITLVRDQYSVFSQQKKLRLISSLMSALDGKIDFSYERTAAFLLLIKSSLLRWRARLERGPNQRNSNAEALGCCERSFKLAHNRGCLLQKALISYQSGLAFQIHEAPKHEPFFKTCFEIIESPELADFPPAIKYRPRLYRETYRFRDSINSFWSGAARYPAEFKRIGYIIGEAASGEYNHRDGSSVQHLSDVTEHLEQAISEGYCHARNIISYIGCRGALEPNWFREELLDEILENWTINWMNLIRRVRDAIYKPDDKYDEPGFGVEGGEFWSTVGGVTGRILGDHDKAIRLLHIAENHLEVSGGKFRAYVALARQYKAVGDDFKYKHYLKAMRGVARAHHRVIFEQLENLVPTPS
jgi:hypothetical protein